MMDGLGIANELKPKIIYQETAGQSEAAVISGQSEVVFGPVSEIMHGHLDILGLLPSEFQSPLVMIAAVSTNAANPARVKALMQFLAGPKAPPVLKANGMEPPPRK